MKVVIDTCVIIDVLQQREPFWEDSYHVFRLVADEKVEGIITAKSLTDIFYIIHKATHSNERTEEIIQKLLELFSLEDTMAEDCKNALLYRESRDFEDSIMIETGKRLGAKYIVTRNTKDYEGASIPAVLPANLSQYI
jgi:predicted nucleic acid-binding protein